MTKNFPKPLLKIGENTILGRMLDDIDRIPEIDEHIIISNHKFAHIFEEWAEKRSLDYVTSSTSVTTRQSQCEHRFALTAPSVRDDKGEGARDDIKGGRYDNPSVISTKQSAWRDPMRSLGARKPITIVDDGTETNETRLGAVCDLLFAMDKLHIDDDLLVVAADNLLFFSFQEFVDFARAKGTSCIMCHEQPSIEKLQRTGVVELDYNNKVLGMEEKPQVPKSHWAVPPFYVYLKKDLDLVRHSVENGCGKDAPGNLAHYMVEHTTMHAWPMSAGRFDIGSIDTYEEAKRKFG